MKLQRVYLDTSVLGGYLEYGYKPLQIYSPREVTIYGTAED